MKASSGLLDRLAHQHGLLTTPLVGTVLVLLAVALAGALYLRTRRAGGIRPLGTGRFTVRAAAVLAVLVLAAAGYVNAYAGYLPTAQALAQAVTLTPGATAGGQLTSVQIDAPALRMGHGETDIWTPAGYSSSPHRRYPVLYLITGSPGAPADWFRAGRLAETLDALTKAGRMPPAIVVAMNTGAGLVGDTESLDVVGGPQVETYYTHVVVPYVDSHYRTLPDRADRVLGGISSGGYGALNVGLHHTDLFATILAFEPYGDPGPGTAYTLLGGDQARFRANSPSVYIPTMRFTVPVSVFLDVGGATGPDVAQVRALADALRARGQDVLFRVEPGQHHTWSETAAGLPYGLAFAGQHLGHGPR
ncbi:enterochelin esterase-like enzyme [Georgenia soli]|uniref:Enterochelin esterase-like enzyme n=1 Tax=Georgenia soli TaxID=638953 RepID=A0A2A9EM93_9MICO|nr:alpha/beta hydrolase-fold protein [Georgenia soli]PFG39355.1 enterochelin esterase-like enzyme [Georgenia soli]